MATLLKCARSLKKREQISVAISGGSSQITATETWQVIYDGLVDKAVVLTAAGLPYTGNAYNGLQCTRVNPVRTTESPYAWEVTVDYATVAGGSGNAKNWNIDLDRDSVAREETAVQDRLNLPLVNAAGEALVTLPTDTLYDELLNISWSTSTPPWWADQNFEGFTNSDNVSFTIAQITRNFSAGQAKCTAMKLKSSRSQTGGSPTNPIYTFQYNCAISMQIRKPKWIWYAPNEGYRGMIMVDATPGPDDFLDTFRDPQHWGGVPRTKPTALDENGYELAAGKQKLRLPDDLYGKPAPNAGRKYDPDGAFELPYQIPFAALFAGLNDGDQHP